VVITQKLCLSTGTHIFLILSLFDDSKKFIYLTDHVSARGQCCGFKKYALLQRLHQAFKTDSLNQHLKGLSHKIEMSYKLYKSTEPSEKMNLLSFVKLSFSSRIFTFTFSFFRGTVLRKGCLFLS
jgi:hypothetical protein